MGPDTRRLRSICMRDAVEGADLSHTVEQVGLALCATDPDDVRIEDYLAEVAGGSREVAALAMSYALRRIERDGPDDAVERLVRLLEGAMRRMKTDR